LRASDTDAEAAEADAFNAAGDVNTLSGGGKYVLLNFERRFVKMMYSRVKS
jgi:hypothetical protein